MKFLYPIDLTGRAIDNVADPVDPQDAVTKAALEARAPEVQGIPFNGVDNSFYYTPHDAALNITGDIDMRVRAKMTSYNTGTWQPLVGKWTTGQYLLALLNNLMYVYYQTASGPMAQTFNVSAVPVNTPLWFRGTIDVDNGAAGHTVTGYYSVDGVTWTALGAPVVVGGVIAISTSTDNLELGSWSSGAVRLIGTIYEMEIRSGINGTIVTRVDGRNVGDFLSYREANHRQWYLWNLQGRGMGFGNAASQYKVAAGSVGVLDAMDPTVNGQLATVAMTASRSAAATDVGKVVETDVAGANVYTVQTNATVPMPANALIEVCQIGAGQTSIAAASGVTILPNTKLKVGERYGSISLRRRGTTDTWIIAGNLVA